MTPAPQSSAAPGPWLCGLALSACGGGSPAPAPAGTGGESTMSFQDVAGELGLERENVCGSYENPYILESLGSGAAWLDADDDGDLDLYVVNGSRLVPEPGEETANQLYRNDGGERFVDTAAESGVDCERWGIGCAVGDIDGDGRAELYVANFGANRMYQREERGFTDVAGSSPLAGESMSSSAAFGDPDLDGDLDLYVANYLHFDPEAPPNGGRPCHWHTHAVYCGPDGLTPQADALFTNDGRGGFSDTTAKSGVDVAPAFGLGVVFGDYDLDGDADLYVANDSTPNFLFHNQGDGTFQDVAIALGAGHSEDGQEQAGMGVDLADYDNDGDPDLFVTNFSDDYNTLYRNEKGHFFKDVSAYAGLVHPSVYSLGWGTHLADFDNDGWLDVFVANGHVYPQADEPGTNTSYRQENALLRNRGDGRFVDESQSAGPGLQVRQSSRGTALADFDDDGDLDVFIVNEGAAPTLLRNDSPGDAAWLRVRLRGVQANRFGIGARLRLSTSEGTQTRELRRGAGYASSQEPLVHFGLGEASSIEELRVEWPGGETQLFRELPLRSTVLLTEGETTARIVAGE